MLWLNYLWIFWRKCLLDQAGHPIAFALFLKTQVIVTPLSWTGSFLPSSLSQVPSCVAKTFQGAGNRKETPVTRFQAPGTQMKVFNCGQIQSGPSARPTVLQGAVTRFGALGFTCNHRHSLPAKKAPALRGEKASNASGRPEDSLPSSLFIYISAGLTRWGLQDRGDSRGGFKGEWKW